MPPSPFDFGPGFAHATPPASQPLDFDPLIKALLARNTVEHDQAAADLAKQRLAFQIAQEKTKQAQLAHSQEVTGQAGDFANSLFEALANGGHLDSVLRETGVIPTPGPLTRPGSTVAPTDTPGPGLAVPTDAMVGASALPNPNSLALLPPELRQRILTNLQRMSPEAKQLFVQHDLPALSGFPGEKDRAAAAPAPKEVSLGDKNTVFYPDAPNDQGGKGGYLINGKIVAEPPRGIPAAQQAELDLKRNDRQTKDFLTRKDIGGLMQRAPTLALASELLDRAQNSPDPAERRALYGSVFVNFMSTIDPKAQIRTQMLQYITSIDKSLGGSWAVLRDKLIRGELPPAVLNAMARIVQNATQTAQDEYAQARAGEVKRRPHLDSYLPTANEIFDMSKSRLNIDGTAAAPTQQRGGLTPLPGAIPPPPPKKQP